MTELQMGLIALGAAAVVGVFGYNKWQENRHRKMAEAVLKRQHEDVLLGDAPKVATRSVVTERSEPEIGIEQPEENYSQRLEPVMAVEDEPIAQEAEVAVITPPEASDDRSFVAEEIIDYPVTELPEALLDPRLEFIVAMELVDPVSVHQILHSQREVLQKVSKPVHWVGFNDLTREWVRLGADANMNVRRLRVGLQLANRMGPVTDADLVVFAGAMQALADELMAVADMPSIRVRDQAVEIDHFCAEVDLEIGINLVSKGTPFSGTKIRALAEAAGMILGADSLFTRYDDDGRAQFYLQNLESTQFSPESIRTMTTHGLTFLLDVPRVDHGERVFMQMAELAKRFAETLHGTLVDDNRQALSDVQLEHIRREFIGKPQAVMASYSLPAGSAQALRLFS
jgi:FtsZ-interacting cell division protein ZipA